MCFLCSVSLPLSLQAQTSGAVTKLFDFGVSQVGKRQQQVRGGFFVFHRNVAIALQPPVRAAQNGCGRVVPVVSITVAHAATEVDERAIEQRAIAVRRRFQLTDELCEFHDVIGRQLRILLDGLGFVSVVRNRVMGLGDADVGVTAAASFMATIAADALSPFCRFGSAPP